MRMNTTMKMIALGLTASALGACAGPTQTESNFGESVRQMISAQTYDPSTLTAPSAEPVDSTDGQLLEGVLEEYRGAVASPDSVSNEIVIGLGGGQR
jgi:hypothetical protein